MSDTLMDRVDFLRWRAGPEEERTGLELAPCGYSSDLAADLDRKIVVEHG
ncbi:hypothetical protein [Acidiphilium sp. 37-64-53]|nr:hypothetical protein [Acidiphilium sp. 37-64-53]